jgi:hypothetical protein
MALMAFIWAGENCPDLKPIELIGVPSIKMNIK